jgi:hypothetical protein
VTILTSIGSMIAVPLFTALALLGLAFGILPIK